MERVELETAASPATSEAAPHPATQTRPLDELQARLGVPVVEELLALAMTHPSAVGEGIERTLLSNQRLEFLGDSLVGAVCAEYFFRSEPQSPEGALTNRKISAVRKDALASAAKRLKLGDYLTFGRGEDIAGGRDRHSNLSDAFEALIAAIFLSNDWAATRDWILLALNEELHKDPSTLIPAKNRLQERTQAMGLGVPRYATTQSQPKLQWFASSVFLGDDLRGQGEGKSKKVAEEAAATIAMRWLEQTATVGEDAAVLTILEAES
ncbi:ribonuclease 3 [Abditibacteriota bacterium]|nr:ribonuclease 3 [Abditibacteriota bacterium]